MCLKAHHSLLALGIAVDASPRTSHCAAATPPTTREIRGAGAGNVEKDDQAMHGTEEDLRAVHLEDLPDVVR